MENEKADNDEEQTFWYVCCDCGEGFYSHLDVPGRDTTVLCYRCWKDVHSWIKGDICVE